MPARIAEYEVECELGRGGMGVVYLARDPQLNRPVAIKILPDDWTDEEVSRFEREARTAAQLNHPNVATIYQHKTLAEIATMMNKQLVKLDELTKYQAWSSNVSSA